MVFSLSDELVFPRPELPDEDGLLAVGGDLSPERLLLAYHNGIFPWFTDGSPILWHSPHERFVLFPNGIRISASMRQVLKNPTFTITQNTAFADVIENCAGMRRAAGTWITAEMQEAYIKLHELGHASSVEVWFSGQLAGGLYGVVVNKVFCGESMFSRQSNSSKAALIWLCQHGGYRMIDCQVHTDHLARMGARLISRREYMAVLSDTSPHSN